VYTKPAIACEMKIRTVHPYSSPPTYEVLLFSRGDKYWHCLTMSNGARALFTHPPASEREAREIIQEFERQRNVRAIAA
jgi:hypothetical protein